MGPQAQSAAAGEAKPRKARGACGDTGNPERSAFVLIDFPVKKKNPRKHRHSSVAFG